MVIKRFGVWSVARLYAGICGGMGLLFGLIVAAASLLGAGLATAAHSQNASPLGGAFAAVLGVGAVIILPLFYAVMGLVMGAFAAWLYNVFAGIFGGVDIDVQS